MLPGLEVPGGGGVFKLEIVYTLPESFSVYTIRWPIDCKYKLTRQIKIVMARMNDELRQEKSKNILAAILEVVKGYSAGEALDVLAPPVSFFLIGVADMTGKDRRDIMELFFKMVRSGADFPGKTIK